jgi:hypothetical protein
MEAVCSPEMLIPIYQTTWCQSRRPMYENSSLWKSQVSYNPILYLSVIIFARSNRNFGEIYICINLDTDFCFISTPLLAAPEQIGGCVGFEVYTAVVLKSIFFWDMTPCSALSGTRSFGGRYSSKLVATGFPLFRYYNSDSQKTKRNKGRLQDLGSCDCFYIDRNLQRVQLPTTTSLSLLYLSHFPCLSKFLSRWLAQTICINTRTSSHRQRFNSLPFSGTSMFCKKY